MAVVSVQRPDGYKGLADVQSRGAGYLPPLTGAVLGVSRLRELLLASSRIFADETVVLVIDPGRGRTKQGYFWAIGRDDRPWAGREPPTTVHNYAPGRAYIQAARLLGGYRGILQCDGYAAYRAVAGARTNDEAVTLAFCWSHVRCGFYDLAKAHAP